MHRRIRRGVLPVALSLAAVPQLAVTAEPASAATVPALAGWFPAAYGAAANPIKAPLNFNGDGRGCNAVTGDLVVDTATYDADGALLALSLRFAQICDGNPAPLRGALRWTR